MADDAQSPLRPELEDLIAFRLAQKAWRHMLAVVTPILALLALFGYKSLTDVQNDLKKKGDELVVATRETEARVETLKALTTALQATLGEQAVKLAQNDVDAAESRRRVQEAYDQMVRQAAETDGKVRDAVGRTDLATTTLQETIRRQDSDAQARLRQMMTAVNQTRTDAEQTLRAAETARMQTVGAKQRQELVGTPFDVFFDGVSRDALRDFKLYYHDGAEIVAERRDRLTGREVIVPNERPEYHIQVVNVLDIPGGLLRLNGSSRADAATFRITRILPAPSGQLTATP